MALFLVVGLGAATAQAGQTWALVDFFDAREIQRDRPEGQPRVTGIVPIWMLAIFHDGSFDAFDLGHPADPALRDFANEGVVDGLREKLSEVDPDGNLLYVVASTNGVFDGNNWSLPFGRPPPLVDRTRHRYVSFLVKIAPTDDGFWGNDNPHQFELFDEAGNFKGPIVFAVHGDDVLDAGTRENREENLLFLDRNLDQINLEAGVATTEPIGKHPGLNGSLRNPDGAPQRALGGTFLWLETGTPRTVAHLYYDPELTDFTRPDHKLFRVKVTSGVHEGYNGAWYDPERDGEGFLFDVLHIGGEPHLSATWFTYEPDGSGRQAFLTGIAPLDFAIAEIDMYQTAGGRFASTENPASVERIPWGRIRVGFYGTQCKEGLVDSIDPFDPRWTATLAPEQTIYLQRPAPLSQAAQRLCARSVAPMYQF